MKHGRPISSTTLGVLGSVLLLTCGCARGWNPWPPDGISVGEVVRRVRGRHSIVGGDVTFPLTRVQVDKSVAEGLSAFARFDGVNGRVKITEGRVDRTARGDMQSLGLGISYAPFCEYLTFDLGGELFHADFAVYSEAGPLKLRISDSAYGYGLTAGAGARWPLTDFLELHVSAGYVLTDNHSAEFELDFDSYTWFIGLRLKKSEE